MTKQTRYSFVAVKAPSYDRPLWPVIAAAFAIGAILATLYVVLPWNDWQFAVNLMLSRS